MSDRKAQKRKWNEENERRYIVNVGIKTGIPAAFDYALRMTGKTKNAFLFEALCEKLIRDGFMTESPKTK